MAALPDSQHRTALILGITGSLGLTTAETLRARGWRVRALHREPERARARLAHLEGVDWRAGDAMDPQAVSAAAEGADLILHGVNPPGYRKWRELALPMLENTIRAATRSGARIIFPGNVYNFGDTLAVADERAPQTPITRKGAVRVDMERMLERAAERGVRTLIVRAGDFFGPSSRGSWFDAVMVKPGKPVRAVTYPGAPDVGHAWAYLPDVAETIARLAAIETGLPAFDVFHFGGHWLEPGAEMIAAIARATGDARLPMRKLPWTLLGLAAPFSPFLRELSEMRYLWRTPLRLDNRKLLATLGQEPHTPLDAAVAATLVALGCLPSANTAAPGRAINVSAVTATQTTRGGPADR